VHVGLADEDRPARRRRAAIVASASGNQSPSTLLPAVVRKPRKAMLSFSAIGIPCRGPRSCPAAIIISAALATWGACSSNTVM